MPSPFPGMDPYLEARHLWPGVHNALAGEIARSLNQSLPKPYYAILELRAELGVAEGEEPRPTIRPDVGVSERPGRPGGDEGGVGGVGVAVAGGPRTAISPSVEVLVRPEPYHLAAVEIRDAATAHRLVTLIEILSPSNKLPGVDRDAYEERRRGILARHANLVEIDLLRRGSRPDPSPELAALLAALDPGPTYLVTVNRYWRRVGDAMGVQLFPIGLRDPLPCIAIPLKEHEPDVPLDLQFAFDRSYDAGPYHRGAVDYALPPDPPLPDPDAPWASALLRHLGLAAPPPGP